MTSNAGGIVTCAACNKPETDALHDPKPGGHKFVPAPIKTWIRGRPYTPILFVMFTLLLWYGFQLLARLVITCLPGGDACLLGWAPWPLHLMVWPIPTPPQYLYGKGWLDAMVSLVTLAFALWPAIQIFFPPEPL